MNLRFASLFSCLAALGAAFAEDAPPGQAAVAPPLIECPPAKIQELGLWDDAFAPPDDDFMFLRRGDSIFLLPMDRPDPPAHVLSDPVLLESRIIDAGRSGEKSWLFMESKRSAPFAIELISGKKVVFEIPGLKVPGEQAPVIQWCAALPHAHAALLYVSGGDQATWPRDGNRPVYFWMSLESGKVVRFPVGWDLNYFSADQSLAVFGTTKKEADGWRALEAVTLRSGEMGAPVPDRKTERVIGFDWSDRNMVKALYTQRAETAGRTYFSGVSVDGVAYPVVMDRGSADKYLGVAKAQDGFVGFGLRPSGESKSDSFWLMELRAGATPKRVREDFVDFEMLGRGNCVIATHGHGHRAESSEGYFLPSDGSLPWNLLDGVERLPKLPEEVKGDEAVTDKMVVEFVRGFGKAPGKARVLAIFGHYRLDRRIEFVPPDRTRTAPKIPGLEDAMWGRTLLLDGEGRRRMTDLFRDAQIPTNLWMHQSGRIVMTKNTGKGNEVAGRRQVELQAASIAFGE